MGTLTSPKFRIMGPKLSFLLGGGCDLGKIRVELLVNDQVVRKAFADECRENLRRREWDVRQFKNQVGQVRLVDASRKGHINFDDLWGDFTCNGECFFLLKLIRGIEIFTAAIAAAGIALVTILQTVVSSFFVTAGTHDPE